MDTKSGKSVYVADLPLFEYKALPTPASAEQSYIRLIELLPAQNFDAVLVCSIKEAKLGKAEYEALSYVCGSHNDKPDVVCYDSRDLEYLIGRLPVYQNLATALRYLRCESRPRTLWVDAICINQDDLHEKEQQIKILSQIYAKASPCTIFIGEADAKTRRVFWICRLLMLSFIPMFIASLMNFILRWSLLWLLRYTEGLPKVNRKVTSALDRGRTGLSGAKIGIVTFQMVLRFLPGTSWEVFSASLQSMLEREWFHRTWTLQELLVNWFPTLMCGHHSISFYPLAIVASVILPILRKQATNPAADDNYIFQSGSGRLFSKVWFCAAMAYKQFVEPAIGEDMIQQLWMGSTSRYSLDLGILNVLINVKHYESYDEKDKVMGSISLFDCVGATIKPPVDYSLTTAELYIAATRAWLLHFRGLEIMLFAVTDRETPGLPSWTVDWNSRTTEDFRLAYSDYLGMGYAWAADTRSRVPEEDAAWTDIASTNLQDPVLRLRGIWKGSVKHTMGPASTSRTSPDSDIALDRQCVRWLLSLKATSERTTRARLRQLARLVRCKKGWAAQLKLTEIFDYLRQYYDAAIRLAEHVETDPDHELQMRLTELGVLSETSQSPVLEFFRARVASETLFVTTEGEMGFSFSHKIREGDNLALLVGCKVSVLLRPSTEQEGRSMFVSPALISECMPGIDRSLDAEGQKMSVIELV